MGTIVRIDDTLEMQVQKRTAELTQALAAQQDVADRLRAAFATDLLFQGLLDTDGALRDANPASLAAIHCRLEDVVGKPFWARPGSRRPLASRSESAAPWKTPPGAGPCGRTSA